MGPEIEYASNAPLTDLLLSLTRPGDFCAHGRMFLPMPTIDIEGVGRLSFPVVASQVRAMIGVAERAPYGKGTQTVVDTSVRDCWQIDTTRLQVAGTAWGDTLATILGAASEGLGCPAERMDARLYKLLIYPTGGFFAPHRDTEKSDGMVATLTISLPTDGTGGELVVRHRDREVVMELGAVEPSELAFAAFYADCSHETLPVRTGHRLSLVYNLCVLPTDTDTPRLAPDYTAEIDAAARHLAEWRDNGGTDKLVWVLEHDYSESGLSFDTLKNADSAVSRALAVAAERAGCAFHAAIVHIQEEGTAVYPDGDYVESRDWRESEAERMAIGDLFDSRHWLDCWVGRHGAHGKSEGGLPFSEVPIFPKELLPPDVLRDAVPDKQRVHEASGNEGVSLERTYRRAALVIWPESKTLDIAASAGIDCAIEFVASQHAGDAISRKSVLGLGRRLIALWPHDEYGREDDATASRVRMLDLLLAINDAALTQRFLRQVALRRYDGGEKENLLSALAMLDDQAREHFLADFTRAHFVHSPDHRRFAAARRRIGHRRPRCASQQRRRSRLGVARPVRRDTRAGEVVGVQGPEDDRRTRNPRPIRPHLALRSGRCRLGRSHAAIGAR